jgi:hypothetical protein
MLQPLGQYAWSTTYYIDFSFSLFMFLLRFAIGIINLPSLVKGDIIDDLLV